MAIFITNIYPSIYALTIIIYISMQIIFTSPTSLGIIASLAFITAILTIFRRIIPFSIWTLTKFISRIKNSISSTLLQTYSTFSCSYKAILRWLIVVYNTKFINSYDSIINSYIINFSMSILTTTQIITAIPGYGFISCSYIYKIRFFITNTFNIFWIWFSLIFIEKKLDLFNWSTHTNIIPFFNTYNMFTYSYSWIPPPKFLITKN